MFNLSVNFGAGNSITVSDASMLHQEEDKKLACIQLVDRSFYQRNYLKWQSMIQIGILTPNTAIKMVPTVDFFFFGLAKGKKFIEFIQEDIE